MRRLHVRFMRDQMGIRLILEEIECLIVSLDTNQTLEEFVDNL
jgi:hypothetical protein